MYTREEVLRGKLAIAAQTIEEARKIVEMFPEVFTEPEKWIEYWDTHEENTCYTPSRISFDSIGFRNEQGYTIIPLSSISDLSEQSGEGVREELESIKNQIIHLIDINALRHNDVPAITLDDMHMILEDVFKN